MKRKIIEISSAVFLIILSFFYTDKAVDIVRRNDPVMKEIVSVAKEYEITPVNAMLMEDDIILPGNSGKKVNIDKSYQKMKQYGKFKESLLVFEEIKPTISIEEYYDRYISSGIPTKNSVALVFKVSAQDNIDDIVKQLNDKNIRATFFIDGVFIEKNPESVYELARDEHQLEVLNYNNSYEEASFQLSRDMLQNITNLKGKFCYAEYDQKEVLELCEKKKMHTIIPTILAKNHPYVEVKNKLEKGAIIGLPVNATVKKELGTILNYINQKGYSIDTLEVLLNEANNLEK